MMDNAEHVDLPFKVGQMAESKSFLHGFRGAWFRCKIKDIRLKKGPRRHLSKKKGPMRHLLEFVDFPDDKITWTNLYQKPSKSKEVKRQLMVRPHFPPIYRESQIPDVNSILEVAVIVDDVWKVGDLVDWLFESCYWSGRVTELLGDEQVKIELFPPPMGEGLSYEVFRKDLRPSLDWTPEYGWTVPIPVENGNGHSCARIIKPFNQGGPPNLMIHAEAKGRNGVQAAVRASLECNASFNSDISASSLQPTDGSEQMPGLPLIITTSKEIGTSETKLELDIGDIGIGKTSCSDSVSSSHFRDASANILGNTAGQGKNDSSGSSKKLKADGSISLNSMCSDTIEAAVMDLEELVNRAKWIRGFLELGKPLSNTVQNPWKFLEHRASSTPK